jgi:hypothetical protein
VVGFASAQDPLFKELPKPGVVAPIHVQPDYWLPGTKSVISFFAPFSKEIKASYKDVDKLPSLPWVSGRLNGEVFINVLRRATFRLIEKTGGGLLFPICKNITGPKIFYPCGRNAMWASLPEWAHSVFIADC